MQLKHTLLLTTVLLISLSVLAQTKKPTKPSFDPFKIKAEYFAKSNIKNDLEFSKDGKEYKIKNDSKGKGILIKHKKKWVKHGIYYKYSSGRLTSKTSFKFGKKDGPYESYHLNGKVRFQYTYKQDIKEGKHYQYRDDGSLYIEKNYKNNLVQGEKITYYSDGKKHFVTQIIDSKKNGESLQYNKEGKLIARKIFEDGKQIGKTQWYR